MRIPGFSADSALRPSPASGRLTVTKESRSAVAPAAPPGAEILDSYCPRGKVAVFVRDCLIPRFEIVDLGNNNYTVRVTGCYRYAETGHVECQRFR
jgi:hypothetical protein